MMDTHLVQGYAAKMVSELLNACLQDGMFDVLLTKHQYDPADRDAIKQELQNIADMHAERAVYHRDRRNQSLARG